MSTTGATLDLVSPVESTAVQSGSSNPCQPDGCSPAGGPQCHPDNVSCRPY